MMCGCQIIAEPHTVVGNKFMKLLSCSYRNRERNFSSLAPLSSTPTTTTFGPFPGTSLRRQAYLLDLALAATEHETSSFGLQYDVPNVIEYILNMTGYPSLTYVGHSEGTTQMFASLIQLVHIVACTPIP
jgi:hypothetical protein